MMKPNESLEETAAREATEAHRAREWTQAQQRGRILQEISIERQRQISGEGWSASHDDEHTEGELAAAAACYAVPKPCPMRWQFNREDASGGRGECPMWEDVRQLVPRWWPQSWHWSWWKPRERRRDLIRAAALIVAEIERLERAEFPAKYGTRDHG